MNVRLLLLKLLLLRLLRLVLWQVVWLLLLLLLLLLHWVRLQPDCCIVLLEELIHRPPRPKNIRWDGAHVRIAGYKQRKGRERGRKGGK